jgi:hypothetical protein
MAFRIFMTHYIPLVICHAIIPYLYKTNLIEQIFIFLKLWERKIKVYYLYRIANILAERLWSNARSKGGPYVQVVTMV